MGTPMRSAMPDARRRGTFAKAGGILWGWLVSYGLAVTGLLPDLVNDTNKMSESFVRRPAAPPSSTRDLEAAAAERSGEPAVTSPKRARII